MTNKTPAELRRDRVNILTQARGILDTAEKEKRELTNEENGRFGVCLDKAARLAFAINKLDPAGDPLETGQGRSLKEMENELSRTPEPRAGRPDPNEGESASLRSSRSEAEVRVYRPAESLRAGWQGHLPDGIRADELSLGRAVKSMLTGDWSQAQAEWRAMGGSSDVLGGFLMPDPMSLVVIDLARNETVCFKAGAGTVKMDGASLTMARVTGDPTVAWKRENAAAAVSDGGVGAVTLKAKTLVGLVKVSLELVSDAPNAGAVIKHALGAAIAIELDRVLLRGKGAAIEPMDVHNWPAVQLIDMGTNGATITDYTKSRMPS